MTANIALIAKATPIWMIDIELCALQAKLAFERLQIPHIYHPFICGPSNTLVDKLKEETGAKIHIPPSVLNKDEIVVSGDKDGVMRAKETIMKIYQEKVHFLGF